MRFSSASLDEMRERIPLSAIVGRTVIWDKKKTSAARRDYWACCPFHGEKSPSFHVDDRKGRAHCFGCGWDGDHFKFLMEKHGRSFPEAVEELAREAGITLQEPSPEERAKAIKRMSLVEANEKAAGWYQERLAASPEVLAYVERRGISRAEVAAFRLGYAPDGNALLRAQLGQERDLIEAGLLGRSEDGRVYDRFRNRLMFPIFDKKGQAVAFSGRALNDKDEAKYLNSPETPIFEKGSILYNGSAAREAAWNGAQLVVVEGNVDVIATVRAGFAGAAPLGTALTDQHVQLMIKATDSAVICFDGDAAGRKAAHRAIDLILPVVSPQFTARFATLPDGVDPDAMVRRSADGFAQAIKDAVPLADMLWRREVAGISPGVPEQRAKLETNLRAALQLIKDLPTKRAYGADFKDRLAALGKRPTSYRSNSYSQHSTSPGALRLMNGYTRAVGLSLREAILVGAIASAPHAALDHAETLSADARLSAQALALVNTLVGAMMNAPDQAMEEILQATGLMDVVQEAITKANAAGVVMEIGGEGDAARGVLSATRH